jgi:hypothetical protein
MEYVV